MVKVVYQRNMCKPWFSVKNTANFPLEDNMSANFLSILKKSLQGGRVKAKGHRVGNVNFQRAGKVRSQNNIYIFWKQNIKQKIRRKEYDSPMQDLPSRWVPMMVNPAALWTCRPYYNGSRRFHRLTSRNVLPSEISSKTVLHPESPHPELHCSSHLLPSQQSHLNNFCRLCLSFSNTPASFVVS